MKRPASPQRSKRSPFRERGVEVIVVDGGSRDDTVDYARPLADKVLSAPRGRAAQMNAGAAAASGDVLLFLHADTHAAAEAPTAWCSTVSPTPVESGAAST